LPGLSGVVADAAEGVLEVLDRYRFDRTADCVFPQELGDYGRFHEMLRFMTGLRCPGNCRDGWQDAESCQVRACCRDRGYFACHECDQFETCAKLRSLHQGLHAEASLQNLRAIREMGLDAWLARWPRPMVQCGDGPAHGGPGR
jgi:hypothetical protein